MLRWLVRRLHAPTRTLLADVSIGAGSYEFQCLDVEGNVVIAAGTRVTVLDDVAVRDGAVLTLEGRGHVWSAESMALLGRAIVRAGDLALTTDTLLIEERSVLDGTGRYSGGGGAGCSAITGRGASGGGQGAHLGADGGSGGGCRGTSGLGGGRGIGGGTSGAEGCDCVCSVSYVHDPSAASGGAGAIAVAGAGGGGGAGGDGGDGGFGRFPITNTTIPGAIGGRRLFTSGELPNAGGGGGGGGGQDYPEADRFVCGLNGGHGGGHLSLTIGTLTNRGRISVDGLAGQTASARNRASPSAGGGGGSIVVIADAMTNVGTITATGGRGGDHLNEGALCGDNSGGGGGGGGGGYVYLDVATIAPGATSRITVSGGIGGDSQCGAGDGQPGDPGILYCVGGCP